MSLLANDTVSSPPKSVLFLPGPYTKTSTNKVNKNKTKNEINKQYNKGKVSEGKKRRKGQNTEKSLPYLTHDAKESNSLIIPKKKQVTVLTYHD